MILIDPDVFRAAEFDIDAQISLIGLARKKKTLRFTIDGGDNESETDQTESKKVQREYLDLFVRYIKQSLKPSYRNEWDEILELLKILLSDSDEYLDPISNQRPNWLEQLILEYHCTEEVEPELLGIANNAQGKELVLLLVGNNQARTKLRHRGLWNSQVRWQFASHMKWLDVRFTNDTDIVPAPIRERPKESIQDRLFELQMGFYLQMMNENLRCIPTPPGVGEQIDIYGRGETYDTLSVFIGECKLRKEGNENNKPVEWKEVRQIFRKMLAAMLYEHRRLMQQEKDCGYVIQVDGALILNTSGFEGIREDFIASSLYLLNTYWPRDGVEYTKSVTLRFIEAKLPIGWSTKADWNVQDINVFSCWNILYDVQKDIDKRWYIEDSSRS